MESLLDKRRNDSKSSVLIKEEKHEISARSEYSSQKSLRHLAQETGFQNTSRNSHKTHEIETI
jgi:hypothetical protein